MHLPGRRIVLTGASGGIGAAAAVALAARGAQLIVSGRDGARLEDLAGRIRSSGGRAAAIVADLSTAEGAQELIARAQAGGERIDVLVNCAGTSHFGSFESTPPEVLERLLQSNVLAPMRLAQQVLPAMRRQGQGLIVNVGSIFGSIGFPCFAGYSTTKFALRGFSEALRRELKGTGIDVLYFAPRYTRTAINTDAVQRMAQAVRMPQDEPVQVARSLVDAIERGQRERFLGASERFFVRLNSLFPRLVDGPLARQAAQMRPFAIESPLSSPIPQVQP